ncbi:MAG TPA: DUF2946 family protein [Burkholderiales bacterium]|nr:DUF2946 family protein [Burkholderiales bacterium]
MVRAMDEMVLRSMAKWPDVPDVYGWLSLDRRGNWLIKGEKIGNAALRDFISRNYAADARGRWYFQNGPQRVFVALAYAPLVLHFDGEALFDHCGRPFQPEQAFLDDEGSVLMLGKPGLGLLDDRDLAGYADRAQGLPEIDCGTVPGRFGFVTNPSA